MIGRPFFVVSKSVTSGLGDALINDIVPDLLNDIPEQPSEEELEQNLCAQNLVVN
jgi:hypothetical protein